MSAPALKVTQYLHELDDRTRPMTEFQLHSIIMECRRTLRQLPNSGDAVPYCVALGAAYMRLHRHQDSYKYFRQAALLEPSNDRHRLNIGAALANLGQYAEALNAFASISDDAFASNSYRDPLAHCLLWANTSECLVRLGLNAEACSALGEAVRVADLTNPQVLMILAEHAAILGADDESLELLARLVARCTQTPLANRAPIDVVTSAPENLQEAMYANASLRAAIERARVFSGIKRPTSRALVARHDDPNRDLADREALEMLEATRAMRARATQAVLGEFDNA